MRDEGRLTISPDKQDASLIAVQDSADLLIAIGKPQVPSGRKHSCPFPIQKRFCPITRD